MNFLDDHQDIEDFAQCVGVHPRTARRWMNQIDGLPYTKLGRRRLLHIPTAQEWLRKRMVYPNPTRGRK